MNEIIVEILDIIFEHLKDDKRGYSEFNNDYYFGRLCSSEELYKHIKNYIIQKKKRNRKGK